MTTLHLSRSQSVCLTRTFIIVFVHLCVDPRYWDTVLEMSWPRFTYVVELNVDSVRNTDPQKLGVIDIRPHYVSMDCFLYIYLKITDESPSLRFQPYF